jgi:predicted transcriptional regulator
MPSKYSYSKYSYYRNRTEIAAHILQAANSLNGITKTKILYATFLSHKQLQEYLPPLIQNGLLEYLGGTKSYRTTERGLKFLKMYEQMEELMTERNLSKIQNK